jgi:hypothetical protein
VKIRVRTDIPNCKYPQLWVKFNHNSDSCSDIKTKQQFFKPKLKSHFPPSRDILKRYYPKFNEWPYTRFLLFCFTSTLQVNQAKDPTLLHDIIVNHPSLGTITYTLIDDIERLDIFRTASDLSHHLYLLIQYIN